ncbi:hypothetical protein K502DRAFT_367743 [Neoconidiobolus thromboides FSU 785]|nr:hypothetical protein K502DRAFT_367743 [Neoconidiobolus thromboides FSU 785]
MTLTPAKKLTHRCDSCHFRSKKCDRKLPICTQCSLEGYKCTLQRGVKNNKRLFEIEDKISCFKLKGRKSSLNINGSYNRDNSNNCRNGNSSKTSSEDEGQYIIKHHVLDNKIDKIYYKLFDNEIKLMMEFSNKNLLENILLFLQYPMLNASNPGFRFLMTTLITVRNLQSKNPLKFNSLKKEGDQKEIREIIELAIKQFFKNEYLLGSMFITKNFDINKLNTYTKIAIITCGLKHLPRTETVINLLNYFEEKLYKFIQPLSQLKVTFDNLRTISIILFGLRNFQWVIKCNNRLLYYLSINVRLLGLNKNIRDKNNRERYLFFNALVFNMSYLYTLISFPYHYIPSYEYTFNYKKQINYYLKEYPIIIQKNEINQIIIIYYHIFNYYIGSLALTIIQLNQIKNQISHYLTNFNEQLNNINNILINLKYNNSYYISIINELIESNNNYCQYNNNKKNSIVKEYTTLLMNFKTHILLFHHYYHFFILSFKLYHSNDILNLALPTTDIDILLPILLVPEDYLDSYLSILIYKSMTVIELVKSTPLTQCNHMHIAVLSQCSIFLIRNQYDKKFNTKIQQSLKSSLNILNILNQTPYNVPHAGINLFLLNCALEENSQNQLTN